MIAREGGAGAKWPTDLFNPVPGRHSETLPVPGGSVTTTVEARRGTKAAPGNTIERTVTTESGGARRIMRELYRVEPADR